MNFRRKNRLLSSSNIIDTQFDINRLKRMLKNNGCTTLVISFVGPHSHKKGCQFILSLTGIANVQFLNPAPVQGDYFTLGVKATSVFGVPPLTVLP